MRCLVEDVDSIFHNNPASYVWFYATLLPFPSMLRVLLLSWHVNYLFVKVAFYALENVKKGKKMKKSLKKVDKNPAPIFKATIFISYL